MRKMLNINVVEMIILRSRVRKENIKEEEANTKITADKRAGNDLRQLSYDKKSGGY